MSFDHDKVVPPGPNQPDPPNRPRLIIYPAYVNNKLSIAEGRKIPASKACEDPNVLEIADCCNIGLKIPAEPEGKSYPRQWWIQGRVRVQIKKSDGSLANPDIPDRKTLLLRIAELVPKHPGRSKKAQAAAAAAQAKAQAAGPSGVDASGKAAAGGGGKKKKGKK